MKNCSQHNDWKYRNHNSALQPSRIRSTEPLLSTAVKYIASTSRNSEN